MRHLPKRSRLGSLAIGVVAIVIGLGPSVPVADASHTADRRRWEDGSGNGLTYLKMYAYGANWTTSAYDRLRDGSDQWRVYSTFNLAISHWQTGDPTNRNIYRVSPPGITGDPAGNNCDITSITPAHTCTWLFGVNAPSPLRIQHVKVVFNKDYSFLAPFYYGLGNNCINNSCYDFMGTASHELGHAGGLYDMVADMDIGCDTTIGGVRNLNYLTMCTTPEAVSGLWVTYYKRTLTTDDQDSMAELYP